MKKNDWILTVTVGLYSFLFYNQTAGINFAIFTITLIAALLIRDSTLSKNKNWILAAAGSLLSAFCIAWYGNSLSVITNIISLSLLSGLSLNDKSSVLVSLLSSFYSYFSSVVFMYLDRLERKKKENSNSNNKNSRKLILIVIPVSITLLFFFMYKESNPLFNDFAKNINLDFISLNWILFTSGGLVLLYGFFYHQKLNPLSDLDENAPNTLSPIKNSSITLFGKIFTEVDENYSGKVLFILLNILLITVNLLDINFLFISHQLPKGLTYSAFVHQGTGTIITSIIIAIIIILFYFRSALNFYEKSRTIKLLVYLWIIQNVFMLISTACRNDLYISEYGLTYKRIGVYVYLFLSSLGLLTTLIKIMKVKSNHFLFRVNGWLFYGVLVVSCLFNWDSIIANFNINDAKRLEKNYLLGLSETNLPKLFILQQDSTLNKKIFNLSPEKNEKVVSSEFNFSNYNKRFDKKLSNQFYHFLIDRDNLNWKSWYYDNSTIYSDLIKLNTEGKIAGLNLSILEIKTLKPLKGFNNITEINLSSNQIWSLSELNYFPHLKNLDLSFNKLINLKGIEICSELEYLNLFENRIFDFSPLYKLQSLVCLRVPNTITEAQYQILQIKLPNTKIIRNK